METNPDRAHDLVGQSDGASNKEQDVMDQRGTGGGYKDPLQFFKKN